MMRLGLERCVDRDEVGFGQELVQGDVVETELLLFILGNPARTPVEDPHREPACSPCHRAADASATAHEPNRLAPCERSLEVSRLRSRKYAGTQRAIAFDDPTGNGEQESEMQVGGRLGHE